MFFPLSHQSEHDLDSRHLAFRTKTEYTSVALSNPYRGTLLQQPLANSCVQVVLLFHKICPAPQQWLLKVWSQTSTIKITWDSNGKTKTRPRSNCIKSEMWGIGPAICVLTSPPCTNQITTWEDEIRGQRMDLKWPLCSSWPASLDCPLEPLENVWC